MAHETLTRINRFVELINCKSDEVKSKLANIEQKSILIITNRNEIWKPVVENIDDEYTIKIFLSAPDGLEYYLKNLTAVVVLDEELKILNDVFISKKIKKFINNKKQKNVLINTKVIGVNKTDLNTDFDFRIQSPEELMPLLKEITQSVED